MDKKTKQYVNNLLNIFFKWFVLLVVILVGVAGYFLVIQPKYEDTLSSIKTELRLKRQGYLTKKEELEKFKELASIYNDLDRQKIERVNTFLPSGYNYERLFTEVDSLVSQNGMILSSMNVNVEGEKEEGGSSQDQSGNTQQDTDSSQKEAPSKVKKVRMKLEIMGVNYSGLKSLISSMENNLRLMDVTKVNFSPNEGTVQLIVWTYYFNAEAFDPTRDVNL